MMTALNVVLLAALMDIKQFGPKDNRLGICGNVIEQLGDGAALDEDVDNALCDLFASWPEKSHSTAYPVGKWSMEPSTLFWLHHDHNKSMWDKSKLYGAARWALLEHCIETLSL